MQARRSTFVYSARIESERNLKAFVFKNSMELSGNSDELMTPALALSRPQSPRPLGKMATQLLDCENDDDERKIDAVSQLSDTSPYKVPANVAKMLSKSHRLIAEVSTLLSGYLHSPAFPNTRVGEHLFPRNVDPTQHSINYRVDHEKNLALFRSHVVGGVTTWDLENDLAGWVNYLESEDFLPLVNNPQFLVLFKYLTTDHENHILKRSVA